MAVIIISTAEDIEHVVGTIDPGAMFSFTFDLLGLVAGTQQLVAGLDSEQVELVGGEREVVVYEGEEETETPPTPPEEVSVVSVDTNLDTNRRVSLSQLPLPLSPPSSLLPPLSLGGCRFTTLPSSESQD